MTDGSGHPTVNWRYRDTVLAVAVLANFAQLGTRFLISPLVPFVMDAFTVSKSLVGVALTGMWAMYALFQYPSGVLGDVYGERRIVLAALGLTALGSLLLSTAPTFLLFGAFAVALGAGAGLYFSVATSLLTKLFDRTGRALSFHTAGGAFAGLAAPTAAGFVALQYGWRNAILLGLAAAGVAFLLVAVTFRPTPPDSPDRSVRRSLRPAVPGDLLSQPGVVATTVVAILAVFTFQAVASFLPTFLVEYHAFSTGRASLAFGGVFFLSGIAQPVMGRVSDRVGRDAALTVSFFTTAVALVSILLLPAPLGTLAAVVLLGVGISWPGVIQARFMDYLAGPDQGTAYGFVRTVYMFFGAAGSVVTGALADGFGWLPALGLPAALLALAGGFLLVNRRRGGRY